MRLKSADPEATEGNVDVMKNNKTEQKTPRLSKFKRGTE